MSRLIERVPTDQIEAAIIRLKSPEYVEKVQFVTYTNDEGGEDASLNSAYATLPELYCELARRLDAGTDAIRNALREFEDK